MKKLLAIIIILICLLILKVDIRYWPTNPPPSLNDKIYVSLFFVLPINNIIQSIQILRGKESYLTLAFWINALIILGFFWFVGFAPPFIYFAAFNMIFAPAMWLQRKKARSGEKDLPKVFE